MRVILFRGKGALRNEAWFEGYLVKTGDHFRISVMNDMVSHGVRPETVGQYTGLTDKNGKRIFEGDIVRELGSVKRTYEVMFDEGRGGWYPFACGDGCGCCEDEVATAEWCEVIGNIHDHPELIAEVRINA